jgi:hypothetical protein
MLPGPPPFAESGDQEDEADVRSRSLLAALLLRRGAVDEASQLLARIRATATDHIRAYAEALAEEYDLDSATG